MYFLQKGKLRSFNLGKWLRSRYDQLLSANYKKKEMYVFSSDADRCLMSASCVLAGMYNTSRGTEWLPDFPWEPVPIHTRPLDDDPFIAMWAPCPMWDKRYADLKKTKVFQDILKKYEEIVKYVSEKTGWKNIDDLEYFRTLYEVIYAYNEHNSSYIPSWVRLGDKDIVTHLAGLSFAMEAYTPELKRLVAGPFLHTLFGHLDTFVQNKDHPKFVMLSGHDTTVSEILHTMDCFNYVPPEFSSTVLWEMHKKPNGHFFVRMFYRTSTKIDELDKLKLPGCDYDCDYADFKKLLRSFDIDEEEWMKECKN